MEEKTYATPESQRRAARAWHDRNKGRQKTISVTLTPQQADEHKKIIGEHGYTTKTFWMAAIKALEEGTFPNAQIERDNAQPGANNSAQPGNISDTEE